MKLGIPQIIFLVLVAINLLLIARLHGTEKSGEYNIWVSLVSTALNIWLLSAGGFF